ncbi:MAG: helix-turn-helix domain-containing protein, partial [Casimicrobium sp.]
ARLGLTQAEVAELSHVTRRTQINYEGGERAPDASYLKLLEGKGFDSHYILTGRRVSETTSRNEATLRVAESGASYQLTGLKAGNVRAATIAVLDHVFADQATKSGNERVALTRVAEAIVVLAEMSETIDDVKRHAPHVLRLLK